MYSLIISTLNTNADAKYFSKWLRDNYTLTYKGLSIGGKVIIQFSAEPSKANKATITDRYQSLTTEDVLVLENIIITYEKRTNDGLNYYNEIRADLSLEYNQEEIDIKQANYIETKLINVKSFLLSGDWVTAQYQTDNVLVKEGKVSEEDIENGFTQERYDNLKEQIDIYVKANY